MLILIHIKFKYKWKKNFIWNIFLFQQIIYKINNIFYYQEDKIHRLY